MSTTDNSFLEGDAAAPPNGDSRAYEIGPFQLDASAKVVTREGSPVPLGPRAVALLSLLVRYANQYVPKARLMDEAWPGAIVVQTNLTVQISAIRRVLAEAPGGDRWIETLNRRGYRFVGPVTPITSDAAIRSGNQRALSNLPEPLTSFVGRVKEVVELRHLLACNRLLTVTGPGGVGKTRVAVQVAVGVKSDWRDGVWFVDLAPTANPSLVPKVVAQALGVMEVASEPLTETLNSRLRSMRALLILDNCEHLLEACAGLIEALLREAPNVRIIATSREAMHVVGEQCYHLSPLSLPTAGDDLETVSESEAVALFVERARLQQQGYVVTAQRAPAIAELCMRLDGMPLALELAAARIAVLPIERIVERLNDRFSLLTGGLRTSLPRHQTLRTTIAWSYDLLSEHARTLFSRLSIFPGGFSLEAAEEVGAGDGIRRNDILDLLSALIDKSLVLVEGSGERYRLLETIRQFARERLQNSGEQATLQERHFDWYLRLATRMEPSLGGGPQQKLALDALEADHDNLRAALAWSFEADKGDSALLLCGVLYRFWSRRGYWREGYAACARALKQSTLLSDKAARAKVLLTAGSIGNNVPEAETRVLLEDAIALSREAGDPNTEAMALNNLARVLDWNVQLARARLLLEQGREINRKLGNKTLELHNMSNLVNVLRRQRHHAEALALAEEGLASSRSLGDRWLEAIFLYVLGRVALDRGDITIAQRLNEQTLAIARDMVMPDWQSFSLVKLAFLAVLRGDAGESRRYLAEAVEICRRFGGRLSLSECFAAMGVLASHAGQHEQAARFSGVSAALLGSLFSSDVLESEITEPYYVKSRQALGDAAYDAATNEGRRLRRETAIDQALTWLAESL